MRIIKKPLLFFAFIVGLIIMIGIVPHCNCNQLEVNNEQEKETIRFNSFEKVTKAKQKSINIEESIGDEYDFSTFDCNGNINYYNYNDFCFSKSVSLKKYDVSMRKTNKAVKNRLRAEDDDEDDPYMNYYYLPCSAICLVYTSFDIDGDGYKDVTYIGSGAMVGHDVVLTAEENTYNTAYGYPTEIRVVPGAYTDDNGILIKPFGESFSEIVYRGKYHTTFNVDDNWAIIKLKDSIGYNSGWLDVSRTNINNGSIIETDGYMLDENRYSICENIGEVSNLKSNSFTSNTNPSVMSNGAPVLGISSGTIYGIQTGERVVNNSNHHSKICRITYEIINLLQDTSGLLEIRIFSDKSSKSSGIIVIGHAWLTIKNNSPWPVTIGKEYVAPNCSISIGTWPASNNSKFKRNHTGLYYNLEYYRYKKYNEFTDRMSYKKNLFVSQWNKVNNYVLENDKWRIFDECACFAVDIWDTLFPQDGFEVLTLNQRPIPETLYSIIRTKDGHKHNESINGNGRVGYYDDSGFHQMYAGDII